MILRLRDFLTTLETIAPTRWAEPWDNPGLQIGSLSQEIRKIFSSLDPTLSALISASEADAQLLFTHHPLIFKPLSRLDINVYPGDVLAEAAKRGIAIVAAHTNLDVARGGINDILADLIGLGDVEVLQPADEAVGVGLGRIGNLPKPAALAEVAKDVEKALGAQRIRAVGRRDVLIHRLAVVGGSGGGLTSLAHEKGAELLITGDIGHHVALEAEALGIALLDGGHFNSERTAFRVFAKNLDRMLTSKGWEASLETDDNETDPLWIDD
ncbi:MAG: Nif3-like dinuclear metal center hexameric protein [Deltaproteobacteria bacterium]|nr:Nif3-like dinuclear metal center hexameric protein [Deltaproteobacteria bacterium]